MQYSSFKPSVVWIKDSSWVHSTCCLLQCISKKASSWSCTFVPRGRIWHRCLSLCLGRRGAEEQADMVFICLFPLFANAIWLSFVRAWTEAFSGEQKMERHEVSAHVRPRGKLLRLQSQFSSVQSTEGLLLICHLFTASFKQTARETLHLSFLSFFLFYF